MRIISGKANDLVTGDELTARPDPYIGLSTITYLAEWQTRQIVFRCLLTSPCIHPLPACR
jgi:hypothetical protein